MVKIEVVNKADTCPNMDSKNKDKLNFLQIQEREVV